jgi:hypothetical protein
MDTVREVATERKTNRIGIYPEKRMKVHSVFVCVRACVRARCVCVCARARARACVRVCVCKGTRGVRDTFYPPSLTGHASIYFQSLTGIVYPI